MERRGRPRCGEQVQGPASCKSWCPLAPAWRDFVRRLNTHAGPVYCRPRRSCSSCRRQPAASTRARRHGSIPPRVIFSMSCGICGTAAGRPSSAGPACARFLSEQAPLDTSVRSVFDGLAVARRCEADRGAPCQGSSGMSVALLPTSMKRAAKKCSCSAQAVPP